MLSPFFDGARPSIRIHVILSVVVVVHMYVDSSARECYNDNNNMKCRCIYVLLIQMLLIMATGFSMKSHNLADAFSVQQQLIGISSSAKEEIMVGLF